MPNVRIQTPIVGLEVWPGELHFLTVYVRDADTGGTFNCTGYTLKAKWTIGSLTGNLTGTFVNANNGHGTITTPSATTYSTIFQDSHWAPSLALVSRTLCSA